MKWSEVSATEPKNSLQVSARASDEIFRLVIESVQDYAIFLLSPEGNVMTWNAGAERIKGYSKSEKLANTSRAFTRVRRRKAAGLSANWKLRQLWDASRMKAGV
jgi:PAS domain-containing protein